MSARRAAALGVASLACLAGPVAYGAGSAQALPTADGSGRIEVTDTETVQVYLDPTGRVDTQRVYEQLVLRGDGRTTVSNPVSTDGLRNLDGFGSPAIKDGAQVATYDVDGVLRTRTVSNHAGDLPLKVDVKYLLDGKEVEPGDVVGADGLLEVRYTIRNVTAAQREVTIPDGRGGTTTRKVEVAVPFAGSLVTTLPSQFTAVEAPKGILAGDGRGGTKVSFTLTLFPPIGAPEATVGWSARIRGGEVPRAELTALPVDPLANPSFGTAVRGYEGGIGKGAELVAGAEELDTNLLRLRDGAADLLGGLLQLHDGADQLSAGLSDKAVPGAKKIAAGSSDAAKGSKDLRDGLTRISDGLGQLADVDGLPAAAAGVEKLQAGVDQLLAGFGSVGTPDTLIDGLARLEAGLAQLSGGLTQLRGDGSPQTPGLVGAKGGVDQVMAGLAASLADGGGLDKLAGGLAILKTLDCGPTCASVIDTQILPGVQESRDQLTLAKGGLAQVSGGLGLAITGLNTQLIPGADKAAGGAKAAKSGAVTLKAGLGQVRTGLSDLETGLTKAVAGVFALDDGAGKATAGAGDLANGLGLLKTGTGELADKLGEAADGAAKISDGLGQAAEGAPQLRDGAGRLSEEGAKVLGTKGSQTAQDFGELLAVMQAGSERAQEEAMAYGAPDGAHGLTAYSFVLKGEDGATGRNLTRGLAGVALLGLGGGAFLLRRRLLPM